MTAPTPSITPSSGEAGQQDLPFAPASTEELLRLLVKAGRAHQLYLPNNPVYKGALEALRGAFASVWQQTEEFTLRFTETEVRWYGRPVLVENTKSADSLPWTFYKDGIREIQLSTGFEDEELVKLLDILQRVRKAAPDDDDLLTMLWEADFANLRYRYVDLGAEPVAAFDAEGEPPEQQSPDQIRGAVHAAAEKPQALVNMQDFDATLYFLEENELEYLRREIEREYEDDLRKNVIAILFDIFEAQSEPAVREELSGLVEGLMLLLLAASHHRSVAYLLAESRVAVGRGQSLTPEQRDRLGTLSERLSAPEPLGQLLQALDEAADLPPQTELTELFEQLHPAALGTILSFLPRVQNYKVRALVEQAADRLARSHTNEVVKLIASPDRAVALEAVRRAGAMKTPAAVAAMAKLLTDSPDVTLRQAAVQALTEIGSAGALQMLERSIEDADRDVRVAAVRALGAKNYRGMFVRLDSVVRGKGIKDADLTEKMAFFEAYGAMAGDNGVPFLDGILNAKGFFGKREDSELRACAAIALGRIGSKKAQESLQRSAAEKDVVVRNAVNRALRATTAA